jgi:hypothetical protein
VVFSAQAGSAMPAMGVHRGLQFGTQPSLLKIEWKYTQQNRRGGIAAGNVAAGWDVQRNCKV